MGINKDDYYYFLHKTKIDDPKTIESMFNEGLKSGYRYSIGSTLAQIDESDLAKYGLEKEMLGYLGDGDEYNSVVLVKIPKKYMGRERHRDGTVDISIPMFREYYEEGGWKWNALFTPKLIQGVYCRDINQSFTNPNFCPVFFPNGCQFSQEQIDTFAGFDQMDLRKDALDRQTISFQQLYEDDKKNNVWGAIVDYYSNLYGVVPRQMVKYTMSDSERELFSKGKRQKF